MQAWTLASAFTKTQVFIKSPGPDREKHKEKVFPNLIKLYERRLYKERAGGLYFADHLLFLSRKALSKSSLPPLIFAKNPDAASLFLCKMQILIPRFPSLLY